MPMNERRGYEARESRDKRSYRDDRNDRRDDRRNDRNGLRSRSDKEPRYHKEISNTLYIGNLSYDTTEEQIEDVFRSIGKVEDVRISYNHGGASKGFAYVEFLNERDA
jgi:RNA recognition motif-containing protein